MFALPGRRRADRVVREPTEAAGGPPEAYAQVLERALAACEADPAAECLDVLELHDELAEAYDPTGSGGGCAAAGGRPG